MFKRGAGEQGLRGGKCRGGTTGSRGRRCRRGNCRVRPVRDVDLSSALDLWSVQLISSLNTNDIERVEFQMYLFCVKERLSASFQVSPCTIRLFFDTSVYIYIGKI